MLLLALSVAPGLAIVWYIYLKDKYEKEPMRLLLVSFILGVLSTIPAVILQELAKLGTGDIFESQSVSLYAFFAFIVVALSEELSKFVMLRYYAYPKADFNEPFDGIIYSVMISMGFATLENILYVQMYGLSTAILRMFLSVPAHAAFAVLMGYYVGLAKFARPNQNVYLRKGLLIAVFFHGSFDFFLFLQQNSSVTIYVSAGLLAIGAIVSFIIAVRLSLKSIRLHQELSRIEFNKRKEQV